MSTSQSIKNPNVSTLGAVKKTAVITGVGPGLGASLVRKFASEGYQVGLLARSSGYIQTLATELGASGTKALALPTDIANSQMVETSFNTIPRRIGRGGCSHQSCW